MVSWPVSQKYCDSLLDAVELAGSVHEELKDKPSPMSTPSPFLRDFSDILRPGVYLLKRGDRVVYIGKARCILAALANHVIRNRTRLPGLLEDALPAIPFDGLEVVPCDPARAILLQRALVELHNPPHNRSRGAPAQPVPAHPPTSPASPAQVRRL